MGNFSTDKQSMIDLMAQKLSQMNLCLRPEYESQKLTAILSGYDYVSLYNDPYYGDCYALEGKDVDHYCVMIKETMDLKDSYSRMQILNQIQISSQGPSNQNTIKISVVDTFQKSGFLWKKYEVYLMSDFIVVDLEKQFQHRIAENTSFSEDEIKTIIKQCAKGFMRLQLAKYRSVRMKYIYMCGRGKQIKLAHPKIFNYQPNLNVLLQDYNSKNIYLSPEEVEYLERNDSNYEGGWSSNAFSFGMIILSLMTMNHLNQVYNYRACEINFARINQLIKKSNGNFSSYLVSIVQNLLNRKQSSRLSLNNLYNQIGSSQNLSMPIEVTLINQKDKQVQYHYEQRVSQPVYTNYISALLKPKVTLTGEYMNLKDEEDGNMFSNDSVIANSRLRYSKPRGGEIGQYMGETSQFQKAKEGEIIRQGKGFYQNKDGQSYIGEWHLGQMQGYGKLFYKNKKLRYEGQFKGGKFHGNGVEFEQEQIKERQDQIDEEYVKIYKGNWIKYQGFYENDLKEGVGKIYFRVGYWRGNLKNGQANGEGVYFCYRTNKSVRGYWREGQLQQQR